MSHGDTVEEESFESAEPGASVPSAGLGGAALRPRVRRLRKDGGQESPASPRRAPVSERGAGDFQPAPRGRNVGVPSSSTLGLTPPGNDAKKAAITFLVGRVEPDASARSRRRE